MAELSLLQAINRTLDEEMERDHRVVVLGEDVGRRGGVFRVTEGLLAKYGEERVIDTPLAEVGIAGVAYGMAAYGLRPVAEFQFADYIHPAWDQIINEAATLRYRSNGAYGCPVVFRAPYGGGIQGGLYHSQSVEGFFAHAPGLKVVIPSTPADARGLLTAAIRDPDPVVFFEPKKGYRLIKGEVPEGEHVVPLGKATVRREGRDLSVFAYGMMAHYALQAVEEVARDGILAELVDLRTLTPVDRETILTSVKKTGKALVVHEDNLTGGYGAEIAAIIADEAFEWLDGPVRRLCGPDVPGVPYARPMQDFFMPSPQKIAAAIRDLAAY
ncbi:MAG: alpha-ketoacid dehydrogenase subunit beta [Ardenticatenaceae bacterium]|nr:alpha-ketoacid dehydrogenase subunit beta [Ardenticatenaceae bacterium]HBY94109.1 alpha-ketoacid dehydrogenase subunit beta [Chloroflexota bacterium]